MSNFDRAQNELFNSSQRTRYQRQIKKKKNKFSWIFKLILSFFFFPSFLFFLFFFNFSSLSHVENALTETESHFDALRKAAKAMIAEGSLVEVSRHAQLRLTCVLESPVPDRSRTSSWLVLWYKDGQVINYLSGRPDLRIVHKPTALDVVPEMIGPHRMFRMSTRTVLSILLIDRLRSSDSGHYACKPSYAESANTTVRVLSGKFISRSTTLSIQSRFAFVFHFYFSFFFSWTEHTHLIGQTVDSHLIYNSDGESGFELIDHNYNHHDDDDLLPSDNVNSATVATGAASRIKQKVFTSFVLVVVSTVLSGYANTLYGCFRCPRWSASVIFVICCFAHA